MHILIALSLGRTIIETMIKNLGERMRKLRKEKGLTLVEIAEKTGVAQATLSRIETGTMTGTVESHEKIAEVLGIGLAELYTGVDSRYEEITHLQEDAEKKVTHHSKDVHIELLTSESSKKKITPYLITLEGDRSLEPERSERGVEKFFYMLEGTSEVTLDGQNYTLKQGETLYFDASLAHQVKNVQQTACKILAAVSPSKL